MKYKLIATIGLSTMMACAPVAEITTAPVEITRTSSFQTAGMLGYSDTTVRTRTIQEGKSGTEISGVPCEIKSAGYTAKFNTPSIVNLPVYGASSPSIFVSCEYNGKVAAKTVKVYNYSMAQRANSAQSAGAAGGLVGILIVSAVSAATNKPRPEDVYKYNVGWMEFPAE